MPRPRTPIAKARLTGAAAHDPQRFRNRFDPEPAPPLGDPPAFLTKAEKAAWRSFAKKWPWLSEPDEPALVALVQFRTVIEDPTTERTAAMFTAYRLMLSDFGGTPVSRSKVHAPQIEDDDVWSQFDPPVAAK